MFHQLTPIAYIRLQNILDSHAFPDIHYLDIYRPARLRPDSVSLFFQFFLIKNPHINDSMLPEIVYT